MKVCLTSLRRAVAFGLILATTILPVPLMAQSGAMVIADVVMEGRELPESPMAKAQREGNARPLTLTEATKMALENNLFDNPDTAIIAQVQQQYWELVLAIRQYEIQRNLTNIARMNLLDARRKLEVSLIANIAVLQEESKVASQEVSMFASETSIIQAQNNLRQTMSNDWTSEIWRKFIVPTDLPDFVEYKIDLDTAVTTALRNRSKTGQNIIVDVINAVRTLESSRMTVGIAAKSRELSQVQYENEQKRYDVGLSNNNALLDAQNAVAQADVQELQALIDYKQAIVNLERFLEEI